MDLDAAAVLSRLVTRGDLPEAEAVQVLRDVRAAPVQRFPHGDPRLEDAQHAQPAASRTSGQVAAKPGCRGSAAISFSGIHATSALSCDHSVIATFAGARPNTVT
jgi:hypothetical protein